MSPAPTPVNIPRIIPAFRANTSYNTFHERDGKGKIKGGIGWNLIILGVNRDPWEFYLMFLSRENDIKHKIYTKIYICKILYKNSRFKRIIFSKYTTNLKTTASFLGSLRSLRNLSLLLLLFEFYNFSIIKDIMIILFIRPYHVTKTPTNGSLVYWSRDTDGVTW